jgi:hypothetical protein
MNIELSWDVIDWGKLKRLERNLANCIVRLRLLLKPGLEGERLVLAA